MSDIFAALCVKAAVEIVRVEQLANDD